jgi:DNA-binding HxlR family transcriptional regulator
MIVKQPYCVKSRELLGQVMDKWSVLVLYTLRNGPLRFNAIRHAINGVTQKALTQCLRRLERNGIIERRVIASSPVAVEYEVTPIGLSLRQLFLSMYAWAHENIGDIERAKAAYDARTGVTPQDPHIDIG